LSRTRSEYKSAKRLINASMPRQCDPTRVEMECSRKNSCSRLRASSREIRSSVLRLRTAIKPNLN
ncbi:unnamed protein product, partial [Rotaria sp. Silwood2]